MLVYHIHIHHPSIYPYGSEPYARELVNPAYGQLVAHSFVPSTPPACTRVSDSPPPQIS